MKTQKSCGMVATRARRYVGWLLRTNRRFGEDKTLRSGRAFAAAFASTDGRSLAPSQITRWESGELAPSRSTIRRYESLLGLGPRSLVTIADTMHRTENSKVVSDPGAVAGMDSDGENSRLHELLEVATAPGSMTGRDWGELGDLVAAQSQLVLHPPRLWRTIVDRLLTELVTTSGLGWFQRQEAISLLLEHRAAGPHAVAACIELCEDTSSPAVIEPLTLLEVTPQPAANRYVLGQLMHPNDDRSLVGALLAAQRKVAQGHFTDDESAGLGDHVVALMLDSALSHTLRPLVADLGLTLGRARPGAKHLQRALLLNDAVSRRVEATMRSEGLPSVGSRIGMHAQAAIADRASEVDVTLVELVDTALFDANSDRRLLAALLIAGSPYRAPVAHALLSEFRMDIKRRDRRLPDSALRTLTDLYTDVHRPLIHEILTRPRFDDVTRHAAAWATPHCSGSFSDVEWRGMLGRQLAAWTQTRSKLDESTIHGVVYGVGTDGHRALLAQIRTNYLLPQSARTTASWLLRDTVLEA